MTHPQGFQPEAFRPESLATFDSEKMGKSTIFRSERVLVGLNAFEPGQELLYAGSPVGDGAVLRVLGSTPELVGRYLKEKLDFLAEHLGETPWSRKW